MKKLVLAITVAAALIFAVAPPADAITDGTLDGDDHPYVGLMVLKDADGNPVSRCSGALISPTVYVTAAHCVDRDGARVTIWFETDLEPNLAELGYPFGGPTSVDGTAFVHPEYDINAFFFEDLAVVVLDDAFTVDRYATLPDVGLVDTFKRGRSGDTVTAVGYGLQDIVQSPQTGPIRLEAERTRYQAELMVVDTRGQVGINNQSMLVSGDAKHGGTCFGDSGGPILFGDTIVAVVSFGLNRQCGGVGGVYRIDFETELGFIESFL